MIWSSLHMSEYQSHSHRGCSNSKHQLMQGPIQVMRSDNGTNLVRSELELCKAAQSLDNTQIENTLLRKGICWLFNPPSGSHHRGIWERQIRTIRRILSALMHQQHTHIFHIYYLCMDNLFRFFLFH